MHLPSIELMKRFTDEYIPKDKEIKILDVGSRIIEGQEQIGSYRQCFKNEKWKYVGVDIEPGNNVDVVMSEYGIPFEDEKFDVVISGQTLEHVEFPWVFIKELARVLKKGGFMFLIAPALIHEHRHPIDTFRYYRDGMISLAKWAELEVIESKRLRVGYKTEDTYLIARK